MVEKERILQIITPLRGLVSYYEVDGKQEHFPVVALALVEQIDEDGDTRFYVKPIDITDLEMHDLDNYTGSGFIIGDDD